jgi:hypothetical protein
MERLMTPWLRYLIAFVVFCHGFIYVRIGSTLPGPIREWKGISWLLGSAVTDERLRALVVGLHAVAGIAILASALAIGFAPSIPGWWRPLAIAGGAVGLVAFAVFWDGQTRLLFQEGAIGAIVSLIMLGIAMAR